LCAGQCGSCWSFSTTGSTEGANFLKHGRLTSLSEQNLVDCSSSYGNHGCNGGLMDNAFEYIIRNKGIDTEESYPYHAAQGACRYDRQHSGGSLVGYTNVPSGNEEALHHAVATEPTSVAIDASHSSFQFYKGGVYDEPACSSTRLDHGVLAVGWGVRDGKDYWLVKNSWGADWGLSGYIEVHRQGACPPLLPALTAHSSLLLPPNRCRGTSTTSAASLPLPRTHTPKTPRRWPTFQTFSKNLINKHSDFVFYFLLAKRNDDVLAPGQCYAAR
jgi:hypothetical protein